MNTSYDVLSLHDTALLYAITGVVGVILYMFLLLSYFYVPNIRSQHPASSLVIWHVVASMMVCIGFIADNPSGHKGLPTEACELVGAYRQFWILASCLWYLMLTLDLFVSLVNPWMGYACKSWAYHSIVWSISAVTAATAYQQHLLGRSSLNLCWIRRTHAPETINIAAWILLFGVIIGIFCLSFAVLVFASFRFVRRQLDVTYRSKRRSLLQYYRYLLVYGGYWTACGVLYYADYREKFHGAMAKRIQIAFAIVYGSYPLLLLIVWIINTELYQNRSSENSMTRDEREAENLDKTDHFSTALRKDLMRYTTAGIRASISDALSDTTKSPSLRRLSVSSVVSSCASPRAIEEDIGSTSGLYSEKKRLATTVYNGEFRYYEKLGFTDYAPKIFQHIREACGIVNSTFEQSFTGTLQERATEGKSGMLFYFTSDTKYLVKTMTKKEHSFLLKILPLYHQYLLKQPNSLLCRFLGCHSMQLPVGWNKMFFVVMENVFSDGAVDERYDLKGIIQEVAGIPTTVLNRRNSYTQRRQHKDDHQSVTVVDEKKQNEERDDTDLEANQTETDPLIHRRESSSSSLRYDTDFICRRASLLVNGTTRANLLAQMTNDCGFLQELGIMDYSCLLGIQNYSTRVDATVLERLAHNAVVSEDQTTIYYLGFVDILQYYGVGWKFQHWILSTIFDKRKITALPPAEYALRFLSFIHTYFLCDNNDRTNVRSYGSVDLTSIPQG